MVGSDEVGYGAWAGELIVCAVAISKDWPLSSLVKDSKAFTGKHARSKREAVAKQIIPSVTYHLVSVSPKEIDEAGVYNVLSAAHRGAIDAVLTKEKEHGVLGNYAVIVDGTLKIGYGDSKMAFSLPKADMLIPAVSAASIIAKDFRDRAMVKLAEQYPGYGFETNAGYGGNAAHTEGLKKLGVCAIHRRSYDPIKEILDQQVTPSFSILDWEKEFPA